MDIHVTGMGAGSVSAPQAQTQSPGAKRAAAPLPHSLSIFGFFALTASMVMTVYEYPTFATSGLHLVFFLLLGGLLWFIPVALCSAEMATVDGWEEGGVFSWVGGMMGERFGFAAIFFQWFQITVGFVTMIYFILGAFSYVVDFPALQSNPFVKFAGVLVVFWLITVSQLGGTRWTSRLTKVGFLAGIVTPAVILFALGIAYIAGGNQLQITFSAAALVPNFSQASTLVVFVSFILAYMGVEASASHINEMARPKRDYPLAMILLVILAILLNTTGGLTVAAVVPPDKLSLSSGVVQAFDYLILFFNQALGWAVKVVAVLLMLGVIGEVSAWVVGPSRGIHVAAKGGLLPPVFTKTNKHGVPVPLVMVQGAVVTVWAAVLTLGGGGQNLSFLTAISLTVVIYLAGYLLLFIAYLKLARRKDIKRAYHVPFGRAGKYIFAIAGLATSVFALVISFFPSSNLQAGQALPYEIILAASFAVTLLIPFLIYGLYGKKHSKAQNGQAPKSGGEPHAVWKK